ncbi:DUF3888 domain-containing protein [Paenibacillus sp. LjRoot153]|uniref:DUF3888 domain-containing protein n=1 Tax=Paenibacillus sp. LjRoot153 TaxID=3342270 RepID=UPI003ECEAC9F
MKTKIILVALITLFAIATPIQANPINPNNDEMPCDVLKDAFVGTLFGSIGNVLSQYKDERQFMADKMLKINRLSWGQYYWETTLKVTTFSGAHNPPYKHYTITFTNQNPEKQIRAIKVIQE